MIIVLGSIIAKPENLPEVLALSREHVLRSQKEPGCISHNVSVDCENPARFTFVEKWADMAALQAHFGLQASQNFVQNLTPFAAAKPEMKIYQAGEIPAG